MPITLDTPVVKEAIASKNFPIMWIYNLLFHCPSPTVTQETGIEGEDPILVGRLMLEAFPMADDGELHTDGKITIDTNELYAVIANVPEAATAFTAILAAVKPVQAYLESRKQIREQQAQQNEEAPQ